MELVMKGDFKMKEQIRKSLEDVIKEEITKISSMETGSKEKASAVGDLQTMYKLLSDETREQMELNEKIAKRESDEEQFYKELEEKTAKRIFEERQFDVECDFKKNDEKFKNSTFENENKFQYLRIGIEVASIIVPIMFYNAWMNRGLKYEESGVFTSKSFKGLINRFKPTNN